MTQTKATGKEIEGGDVWTAWTPTITASTGSFTTVSAAGRYAQIGKIVTFSLKITVTNVGSASGCTYTLPVTHCNSPVSDTVAYGREDAATGRMLQSKTISPTQAGILAYDNASAVVGNGYVLNLKGTYEAA
jgi:hypothetical protein